MTALLTSLRSTGRSSDQEEEVVKLQGSAGGEKQSQHLEEPFAPPDISDRAEYFKC